VSAAGLTGATGPTGPAATSVSGTRGPHGVTGSSVPTVTAQAAIVTATETAASTKAAGRTDQAKNETDSARAKQHSNEQPGPNSDRPKPRDTSLSLDFLAIFLARISATLLQSRSPAPRVNRLLLRPTISMRLTATGRKNLSLNAAPLASIFISARTRLRKSFTRKLPRTMWKSRPIFGSTLTPDLANRLRLSAMRYLPNSQPICPRGYRGQIG
jgi:hypothetical protein